MAVHRRNGEPLSLAPVDLADHFKRFNDTHGHQAGDRLLKSAAAAWREHLRETDLLARWGGEEFTVLLPMSRAHHAVEVMERLRSAMPVGSTCSIGVTEVLPEDGLDDAVQRADAALYEAKASGRNRVVLDQPWPASDGAATLERLGAEIPDEEALDRRSCSTGC